LDNITIKFGKEGSASKHQIRKKKHQEIYTNYKQWQPQFSMSF